MGQLRATFRSMRAVAQRVQQTSRHHAGAGIWRILRKSQEGLLSLSSKGTVSHSCERLRLPSPLPYDIIYLGLGRTPLGGTVCFNDLGDLATWHLLLFHCSVRAFRRPKPTAAVCRVGSGHCTLPHSFGKPDGSGSPTYQMSMFFGELTVDADVLSSYETGRRSYLRLPTRTLVSLISDAELAESYLRKASGLILRDGRRFC